MNMRMILLVSCCLGLVGTGLVQASIVLPGSSSPLAMIHAGFYQEGQILDISATGQINLIGSTGYNWITNPDGSLVVPVNFPAGYSYANIGATNYPTTDGGDGVNHFAGGGANYDTSPLATFGHFGFAGKTTTDTLDPLAIRFGAIVGTFSPTPSRNDWFYIGFGGQVLAPLGGGNLYLAVSDSTSGNNTGAYQVTISSRAVVPEPGSFEIIGLLLAFLMSIKLRR